MGTLVITPESLQRWGIASVSPVGSTAPVATSSSSGTTGLAPHLLAAERVNGLSFSESGRYLVSSHDNGTLQLFNGETGGREAVFASREYGCRHVTHTHHELGVIHAAYTRSATDSLVGQVAYHSLHDNKVVRLFRGHTAPVTSISMHPRSDWFLTASRDGAFRLWDLRQPNCAAMGVLGNGPVNARAAPVFTLPGDPVGAFDLSGRVFAIATPDRMLALYDPSVFSRGPFATTQLPLLAATVKGQAQPQQQPVDTKRSPNSETAIFPSTISWTALEFSPDDRFIAIASADRGILIVDAFAPERELALLSSHPIDSHRPSNASFSPCGRFLATGGADGHVWAYDLAGGDGVFGATQEEGRIQLGILAGDVSLGPLAYAPGRWEPPVAMVGSGYKSAAATAAAMAAAADFVSASSAHLQQLQQQRQDPQSSPTAKSISPALPSASTAEEQVSRHEGPVSVVRFHPRAAVLASASASVAWWLSPPQ